VKAQALVGDPLVGLQGSFSSELSSFHLSVVDCQFPAKDQDGFESVPHRVNRGGRGKELGSNSGSWKSLWSLIESYKENRCCTFSIVFVSYLIATIGSIPPSPLQVFEDFYYTLSSLSSS